MEYDQNWSRVRFDETSCAVESSEGEADRCRSVSTVEPSAETGAGHEEPSSNVLYLGEYPDSDL